MPRCLPEEFFRSSTAVEETPEEAPGPAEPRSRRPRRRETTTDEPAPLTRTFGPRRGLSVRILTAGVVVAFLVGLAIGRVATSTDEPPVVDPPPPSVQESPGNSELSTTAPYDGPVQSVQAIDVHGRCEGGTGHDVPENLIDDSPGTIWRCAGSGAGAQLTFSFAEDTRLVGVRLVNGNTVGEERYLNERRISSVRWTFSDGSWLVQGLAANDPMAQEIRFPPVEVDGPVVMTVESSTIAGDPSPTFDAVSITSLEFLSNI